MNDPWPEVSLGVEWAGLWDGWGGFCLQVLFFHCFTPQSRWQVWFGERMPGGCERGDSLVGLKLITIIELIEEVIMPI